MKLAKILLILCTLFALDLQSVDGENTRVVRGVVITPDGRMVPEFTITVRPVDNKPDLVRRMHFKNGEFALEDLEHDKYQLAITSPRYVGVKLDVDFTTPRRNW